MSAVWMLAAGTLLALWGCWQGRSWDGRVEKARERLLTAKDEHRDELAAVRASHDELRDEWARAHAQERKEWSTQMAQEVELRMGAEHALEATLTAENTDPWARERGQDGIPQDMGEEDLEAIGTEAEDRRYLQLAIDRELAGRLGDGAFDLSDES